jgi:hypothetical protein
MSTDEIVQIFGADARGYALCPGHEDRRPSLHIRAGRDGRAMLHCRAGCRTSDVLRARGLAFRDLFEQSETRVPIVRPQLSPENDARADVEAEFRRQTKKMQPFWGDTGIFALSDDVRVSRKYGDLERRVAAAIRGVATSIGPDDTRTWNILRLAAETETNAIAAEADADALEAELELRARR